MEKKYIFRKSRFYPTHWLVFILVIEENGRCYGRILGLVGVLSSTVYYRDGERATVVFDGVVRTAEEFYGY